MSVAHASERLGAEIRDAAVTATDCVEFRTKVVESVRARIPFDGACLASVDPTTLVPTGLSTVGYDPDVVLLAAELEYGGPAEPSRFETMLRRPEPVRTLREATGGQLRRSRHYADLLAPFGLSDEIRMIFRGRDRLSWGICTMTRRPGRDFSDDDVAVLVRVLPDVGDGLRTTLFREHVRRAAQRPDGPAVAVIGPGNEFESVSEAARDYFDRLAWGPAEGPIARLPALAAALTLRRSGRDSFVMRSRTVDGEWVVVRAGWFDREHPPRRIAVTIERAQLPEIVTLLAIAHGLTRRESEVLRHVLAGRSREEIACTLVISPYTVADHLKAIYTKTGVSSRRDLVARLVHTQYLPRLGGALGPDGFFADA